MQNKLYTIVAIAAAALLLPAGCTDEELVRHEGGLAGGKTRIALGISTPAPVDIRTRAATDYENRIKDCYILRIDATTDKFLDARKIDVAKITDNGTAAPTIVTDMLPVNGNRLVILANTQRAELPAIPAGALATPENINAWFAYRGNDKNFLNADYGGLPMSGEIASYAPGSTCTLTRSVAKIQVRLAPDLVDNTGAFTDNNITWGLGYEQDPTKCTFYPPGSEGVYQPNTEFDKDFILPYKLANSATPYLHLKQYYTPEFNTSDIAGGEVVSVTFWHKDRCHLMLKVRGAGADGEDGYYRIELITKEIADVISYIFLRRNTDITVTITKVNTFGYNEASDAAVMPGVNLEYDVHITDPQSNLTTTNGQYTLSTSNNMAEIYGDANKTFEVAIARFSIGSGVTQDGSLPALTSAVTLHNCNELGQITPGIPAGVQLYTHQLALTGTNYPGGGLQGDSTGINLGFTDKEKKRFVVKIALGNLTQTVLVNRNLPFDASSGFVRRPGQIKSIRWNHQEASFEWENRADADICELSVKDNIYPERWEEDGSLSSKLALRAVPVFKDLTADGFAEHTMIGPGNKLMHNIIRFHITQSAPVYVGWWGGVVDSTGVKGKTFYSKRMIMESMQGREIESPWSTSGPAFSFFGKFYGVEAINLYHQLAVLGTFPVNEALTVFTHCYQRNDINKDGKVDGPPTEPIHWYLPSQAQLMGLWIELANTGNEQYLDEYYWSSTLAPAVPGAPGSDDNGLSGRNTEAYALSLYSGGIYAEGLKVTQSRRIRCVRDLD